MVHKVPPDEPRNRLQIVADLLDLLLLQANLQILSTRIRQPVRVAVEPLRAHDAQ